LNQVGQAVNESTQVQSMRDVRWIEGNETVTVNGEQVDDDG
jgi:hypothetical protein